MGFVLFDFSKNVHSTRYLGIGVGVFMDVAPFDQLVVGERTGGG